MFIPRTRGGWLIRELKAKEEEIKKNYKTRVKLVEQAGSKLSIQLSTSNATKQQCGREKCSICKVEKMVGQCYILLYTLQGKGGNQAVRGGDQQELAGENPGA